MNLEFVFSFNRIHGNYCHRVVLQAWMVLDGRGLRRMLQYATLQTGLFFTTKCHFKGVCGGLRLRPTLSAVELIDT